MPGRVETIGNATLYLGDMREVLKEIEADSIDGCASDPPYHLTSIVKRWGPGGKPTTSTDAYKRASTGFMGKVWDGGDIAFQPETWAEVYRVLKPGAHLVAFGGTRGYHRMICAIEDAGFEIRDGLCWLYGTGFPKSHDIAKTIDKRKDWAALPRFQAAVRGARTAAGMSQSDAARLCGLIGPAEILGGGGFMWFETGLRIPTREQYDRLKVALNLGDDGDEAFEAAEREVVGQYPDEAVPGGFGEHRFSANDRNITEAKTDLARQWEGWGTALKPAWEPIVLARKPIKGTIAANVVKHGTGALNIDGCRIETEETIVATRNIALGSSAGGVFGQATVPGVYEQKEGGRWPANVLHDGSDEVVAAFPDVGKSTGGQASLGAFRSGKVFGKGRDEREQRDPGLGDSGSAARFFYSAKADAVDRLGSKHPTVKPVDLMRWLVRLICPPGGTILDPFAGSGTTGMACLAEGFKAVLIEREAEYFADIVNRIKHIDGSNAPLFDR